MADRAGAQQVYFKLTHCYPNVTGEETQAEKLSSWLKVTGMEPGFNPATLTPPSPAVAAVGLGGSGQLYFYKAPQADSDRGEGTKVPTLGERVRK